MDKLACKDPNVWITIGDIQFNTVYYRQNTPIHPVPDGFNSKFGGQVHV